MKNHLFLFLLMLTSQIVFSQDNTIKEDTAQKSIPKFNKIEFVDGRVLEGDFVISDIEGATGKDKIKVIWKKKENKSREKYSIEEIKKITLLPNEGLIGRFRQQIKKNKPTPFNATSEADLIRYYKVLYSPEEKIPRLAKILYIGDAFEFYSFNKTRFSDKFQHHQTFITRANNNTIEFDYANTNIKNNLKRLNEYFKDCSEFIKESTEKKASKKHDMMYFYKLANKCTM